MRFSGPASRGCGREEMGLLNNKGSRKGSEAEQAKEMAQEPQPLKVEEPPKKSPFSVVSLKNLEKKTCCRRCSEVLFVLLGVLTIVVSLAVIGSSITTALATKIYNSSEYSGRLVAMILVSLTAAVTISLTVYATVAVFRRYQKPLRAAALTLVAMALVQAVISGVSIRMTAEDELVLVQSLDESFKLALNDNPRHAKIWAATSNTLQCCGNYGPEDYRTNIKDLFAPNIPISCCPGYNSDLAEVVQERERQLCRAKREYYERGCGGLVVDVFRETATMVLSVTILLIVLEVVQALFAYGLYVKIKRSKKEEKSVTELPVNP